MTFLKSNITNDKIRYEIKEDFVNFKIAVFETKKELIKLIKFFLMRLKEESCELPVRIKMNDYQKPADMEIVVENIARSNFRFDIRLAQNEFKRFFKFNFEKMLKNNYDLELDYAGNVRTNWNTLATEGNENRISFDYVSHPYGIIFDIIDFKDPNEVLTLVSKMLFVLNKADIMKPFKIRFKNLEIPNDTIYNVYDTSKSNLEKDYLISHNNFMKFFKKNIIFFAELSQIHYDLDIEKPEELDDGWSVAVNTKKQRSIAHGVAKRKLYNLMTQVQESV